MPGTASRRGTSGPPSSSRRGRDATPTFTPSREDRPPRASSPVYSETEQAETPAPRAPRGNTEFENGKRDLGFKPGVKIKLPVLPKVHIDIKDWMWDVRMALLSFTVHSAEYTTPYINALCKEHGKKNNAWEPENEDFVLTQSRTWRQIYAYYRTMMNQLMFDSLVELIKNHIKVEQNGGFTIQLNRWWNSVKSDMEYAGAFCRFGDGHTLFCMLLAHFNSTLADTKKSAQRAYNLEYVQYNPDKPLEYMDNMLKLAKEAGIPEDVNFTNIVDRFDKDPDKRFKMSVWRIKYEDESEQNFDNLYKVWEKMLTNQHTDLKVQGKKKDKWERDLVQGLNAQNRSYGYNYGRASAAVESQWDSPVVYGEFQGLDGYAAAGVSSMVYDEAGIAYENPDYEENYGYGAAGYQQEDDGQYDKESPVYEVLETHTGGRYDEDDRIWDNMTDQYISYKDWVQATPPQVLEMACAVKGKRKGKGRGKKGGTGKKGVRYNWRFRSNTGKGMGKGFWSSQYGKKGKGYATAGTMEISPQYVTELLAYHNPQSDNWLDQVIYNPWYEAYEVDPTGATAENIIAVAKGKGKTRKGDRPGKGKGKVDKHSPEFQQYVLTRPILPEATKVQNGGCIDNANGGKCVFGDRCRFSHSPNVPPRIKGGKGKGAAAPGCVMINGEQFHLMPTGGQLSIGDIGSAHTGHAAAAYETYPGGPGSTAAGRSSILGGPEGYLGGPGAAAAGRSSTPGGPGMTVTISQEQLPALIGAQKFFEQSTHIAEAVARQRRGRALPNSNGSGNDL